MSYNTYFDDVENQLIQITDARKNANMVVWIFLPLAFFAHAVVLAAVVWAVGWLFGNSPTAVGVTCAAYISAVIGWAVGQVHEIVTRMAVHATSVHDEVLLVKELVEDEQRKKVR